MKALKVFLLSAIVGPLVIAGVCLVVWAIIAGVHALDALVGDFTMVIFLASVVCGIVGLLTYYSPDPGRAGPGR